MLQEQRDFREEIDDRLRDEQLFQLIARELTAREFRVVYEMFWDGKGTKEVGEMFNVCRGRIWQIKKNAIRKLRGGKFLTLLVKVGGPLGLAAEKRIKQCN